MKSSFITLRPALFCALLLLVLVQTEFQLNFFAILFLTQPISFSRTFLLCLFFCCSKSFQLDLSFPFLFPANLLNFDLRRSEQRRRPCQLNHLSMYLWGDCGDG